jgi:hypothetical protein
MFALVNCNFMQVIPEATLLKKGRIEKSPLEMTPAERSDWYQLIQKNAKACLFSIGQPLVYKRDGTMIAEYADGRIENLS